MANAVKKVMSTHSWAHNWFKESVGINRIFLENVYEYCVENKCKNNADKQLLENSIKELWRCYSRVLKQKDKEW